MISASRFLNFAMWSNLALRPMERSSESRQTPIRHSLDIRYQVRVASRIGPLVASALQPAWVVSQPPRTRLTIRPREPVDVSVLLRTLDQMNVEVESLRRRGTELEQSDPCDDR